MRPTLAYPACNGWHFRFAIQTFLLSRLLLLLDIPWRFIKHGASSHDCEERRLTCNTKGDSQPWRDSRYGLNSITPNGQITRHFTNPWRLRDSPASLAQETARHIIFHGPS